MRGLACSIGVAAALASAEAWACGGCFTLQQNESTVVTGHRMAMAISPTQSVLWDQIQYSGNPAEFSWVLPVKPGAVLELAHDAWFEALDGTTGEQSQSPFVTCGFGGAKNDDSGFGCGCGSKVTAATTTGGSFEPPAQDEGVTIVHDGTVGPYETVTLHANEPGALENWLAGHGYALPDAVKPTVDAYVAEGFDFIALRLLPTQSVQSMRPVRVVTPGAGFTLPLRMVAAGTGAITAIKLFVLAEGRYRAKGFADAAIDPSALVWDFNASSSNYRDLRKGLLAQRRRQRVLDELRPPGTDAQRRHRRARRGVLLRRNEQRRHHRRGLRAAGQSRRRKGGRHLDLHGRVPHARA